MRYNLKKRIMAFLLAVVMLVGMVPGTSMTAHATESSDNYSFKISSTIGIAAAESDTTMPNVTTSVFIDETPLLYQNETTVPISDGTTHQVTLKNANCATLTGIKINGTEIGIEETSDDLIYLEEAMEDQIDGITSESIVLEYYEASEVTLTFNSLSVTKDVEIEYVYVSNIEAESISLDKTNAEMTVGDSLQLNATILPEDTTDKTLTWKSSDEVVATVVDGKVTAHKAGSARITAATKGDGKIAACDVMVKEVNHEGDGSFTVPADIPVEKGTEVLQQVTAIAESTNEIVISSGETTSKKMKQITFKNLSGSAPQAVGADTYEVVLDPTTDTTKPIEIEVQWTFAKILLHKNYLAIVNGSTRYFTANLIAPDNKSDPNYPFDKLGNTYTIKYNTATEDGGANYFVPAWEEVEGTYQAALQFGYASKNTATSKITNPITVYLKIGTGEAINNQPTIVGDVYKKETIDKNKEFTISVTEKFEDLEGAPLTYIYSVDSDKEEDFKPLPGGILTRTYTRDVGTSGDYVLRFKAFDGEKYSAVYTVDINVINNRPVLNAGITEKTITVFINDQIEIDWTDAFSDKNNDPITYRVEVDGKCKYKAFEDTKDTFVYGTPGTHTFEVWAYDGANYSDKSYKIIINVKEPEVEAPNFDETYDIKINVPKELKPNFYATKMAGYNDVDVYYDTPLVAESGETVNGFTVWTVKVPENISRISYRAVDAEGKSWGGMSIATKAEDGTVTVPVTLRPLKGLIKTRIDGQSLTEDLAEFKVKTYEGSWVAKGDSDTEDGYLFYRYLLAAYDNEATYTYYAVPKGKLAETYSEAVADFNPITPDSAEADIYPLPFNLSSGFKIIAPSDADVKVFNQERYYKAVEQSCLIKEQKGETTEWNFAKIGTGANMSYRVSMEGKITKIGYVSGDSVTITWDEDDAAPTDRVTYDLTTTYGKRAEDSIYLNVNGQNRLVLDENESFTLRPFRIWQLVNSEVDNIMIEPDFTYRIISGGNVVSVAPVSDFNMNAVNNRLLVKAKDNGVAVLEIGYDAVAFDSGEESVYEGTGWTKTFQGRMTYGAVDPARTGLVVVQVGNAATDVDFGIHFSDSANRSWDAEHDTVYFIEENGQISFKPTVKIGSISEVAISNDKGVNWTILTEENDVYTANIVSGNNIIRVKKSDGTEAYQVVRGDKLTVTLFDEDNDGIIESGEEITVRISDMNFPAGKMSGIYNPGGVTTSYTVNGKTISNQTSQYQCSQTELIITVPENAEDGTKIMLSNGMTGSGWMGDPIGSHREITDTGKNMNGTALAQNYSFNVMPDISFSVGGKAANVEQEQENNAPARKGDVNETGEVVSKKIGEVYTLSLDTIFEDIDGDKLNYKVSVNGANAEIVSRNYSFVPTKEGTYTLVFLANDGKTDSLDTYTLTITVNGIADKPEIKFDLNENEISGWVTISFEDYGIRLEDEFEEIDVLYQVPLGGIIEPIKVPYAKYDTIASVTIRLLNAMGMYAGYNGTEYSGFYLTSIGKFIANETYYESFGEKQAGDNSGWMVTLNKGGKDKDWFINKGASAFVVNDGDIIKWKYTCQLGTDIGNTGYLEAAKDVEKLINKIDETDTLASENAIISARKAYDALNSAQQVAVSNYSKLLNAEKALAEIKTSDEQKEAASKVNNMINAIGLPITKDSKASIDKARKAYDMLDPVAKPLCDIEKLETAENLYAQLINGEKASDVYRATGDYLSKLGVPGVGSPGGEWMVIGLARGNKGLSGTITDGYYNGVSQYIDTVFSNNIELKEKVRLDVNKSTDNARIILGLTAAGIDATNVNGYNLFDGLNEMNYIKYQGVNGPMWVLIAFNAHQSYKDELSDDVTEEKLIQAVLDSQLTDGGWDLTNKSADVDMTAMAIQALAPYYNTNLAVKEAVDKALSKLSSMQQKDGSFASIDGVNAESTAQVIVALTSLGINPEEDSRFIKKGMSPVDALCNFAVNGGGFMHTPNTARDGMATEQSYYALVSYFRLLNGQKSLYDMSDVALKTGKINPNAPSAYDIAKANEVEKLISGIGKVTLYSNLKIEAARKAYGKLTAVQKKQVENYDVLVDAEKKYEKLVNEAVEKVEDLIYSIGEVTLESGDDITAARRAYNQLPPHVQKLVKNLKMLEKAEKEYKKLREEALELIRNGKTVLTKSELLELQDKFENVSEKTKYDDALALLITYFNLGEKQQLALAGSEQLETLKAIVAKQNHENPTTGITMYGLEWNIKVITDKLPEKDEQIKEDIVSKLEGAQMLTIWDIYLEDVLTGKRHSLDCVVEVCIPVELIGDYRFYDRLGVVHYADDGSIEVLNCKIVDGYAVFKAADFSYYAIVGFMDAENESEMTTGTVVVETPEYEELIEKAEEFQNADNNWLVWAGTAGVGIVLLAVLLILKRRTTEEIK